MPKSKSRKRPKAARRSRVDEIAALGAVDFAAQLDSGRHEPSYRIKEFCRAEGISKTAYYALKEESLAPEEIRYRGIIRITHRSRLAWQDKMANLPPEMQAASDARGARRQLNARAAAAVAIKSPKHQSNRKRGTHAAMASSSPARFEEHTRKRRSQQEAT